jgi:hypothetical protein
MLDRLAEKIGTWTTNGDTWKLVALLVVAWLITMVLGLTFMFGLSALLLFNLGYVPWWVMLSPLVLGGLVFVGFVMAALSDAKSWHDHYIRLAIKYGDGGDDIQER